MIRTNALGLYEIEASSSPEIPGSAVTELETMYRAYMDAVSIWPPNGTHLRVRAGSFFKPYQRLSRSAYISERDPELGITRSNPGYVSIEIRGQGPVEATGSQGRFSR
jgi:hypothetical protein